MPTTPNIIQTMKQTVKANVLTASTDQARRSMGGEGVLGSECKFMARFFLRGAFMVPE